MILDIKQIGSALKDLQKRTKRHRLSLEHQHDFNDPKHFEQVQNKKLKLDHMLGRIQGAIDCLDGTPTAPATPQEGK